MERPFKDGEYMKESFKQTKRIKNKREIVLKIRDMPLSAKTVKDRTTKITANITSQQVDDIISAPAYSIACDESSDVNDTEQTALLFRYVNSDGPQEEIIALIPLKGQTWGEDIYDAVVNCLKAKRINTTHMVSVATTGAPGMRGEEFFFSSS